VPAEVLTATVSALSAVETGTTSGVVATFTSTYTHVAGDFAAMIQWGDGTSTLGTVVANAGGGFDVVASHAWASDGTFTFTVSVVSNAGASIVKDGTATVAPRMLAAKGASFTIDKKNTFTGMVATFTDNLGGTAASSYVASVAWSDGKVTTATVVKNGDGSFSIRTSRSFSTAGVLVASISVGTVDGAFYGTASLTATVTNKSGKCTGPMEKDLKKLAVLIRSSIHHHAKPKPQPCHGKGHCLK
jgi:hypothetical protein